MIELLVVMGIIALMAGVLGVSRTDGGSSRGLEAAQATVVSLLSAARGQAALHHNRAMLVIDADVAEDRFLRWVQVAVESAPDSGLWWITDARAMLPRGIYVVPGEGAVTGVTFAPAAWPAARHSSVAMVPEGSVSGDPTNPAGKYLGLVVPGSELGRVPLGGGEKLVLAAARRTPAEVCFEHPDQVRGVALSSYGVALFINEARGFDF